LSKYALLWKSASLVCAYVKPSNDKGVMPIPHGP
jgi:hypothetical protein